jgi:hypothetical protein
MNGGSSSHAEKKFPVTLGAGTTVRSRLRLQFTHSSVQDYFELLSASRRLAIHDLNYLLSKMDWLEPTKRSDELAEEFLAIVRAMNVKLPEIREAQKQIRYAIVEFAEETSHEFHISSDPVVRRIEQLEKRVSLLESPHSEYVTDEAQSREQRANMEGEINKILNEKSYREFARFLESDKDALLNVLYDKTEDLEIDLGTEEGKQVWRTVVEFISDKGNQKELDSVYFRLAECSRSKYRKSWNEFIYDALFAINGALSADPRDGFWLADRYAKRSMSKRVEKVKEKLQG